MSRLPPLPRRSVDATLKSRPSSGGYERGVDEVKYVIEWKTRDSAATVEDGKRLLQIFSKWTPSATPLQFLSTLDGTRGLSIVETDNPLDVARDTSKFSEWLDFTVTPVVDIMDAVGVFQEAIDFVESIP